MIDWQEILPVIAFIAYMIFQKVFSRQEEVEESSSDSLTPEERARQIKEEIKRRIQQRQQQPPTAYPQAPQPQTNEPSPLHTDYQQQNYKQPSIFQSPQQVEQNQYSGSALRPEISSEFVEPENHVEDNIDIESLVITRQKQIAKEKIRDGLLRKSNKLKQSIAQKKSSKQDYRGNSIYTITRAFKNPQSARNAFIYSEIFGKPVGLINRKNHKPLWEP